MKKTNLARILIAVVIFTLAALPVYAMTLNEQAVANMSTTDVNNTYHHYFDLNSAQKNELLERGYSEKEIAKIDKEDFRRLELSWKITQAQVFYIKGANPELENLDISNWTNADVHSYVMSKGQAQQELMEPSSEQKLELQRKGVSLSVAREMLRTFRDYDDLLSQPVSVINDLNQKIIQDQQKGSDFLKYLTALKAKHNQNAE